MIDQEVMGRIAQRKIQEAIEEGKFDDLPGKGQPLALEEDQVTPPHLRMANRVLKNAGVLPDWMQVQADIIHERQEAARQRERLIRENAARRARISSLPDDHPIVRQYGVWHTKNRLAFLKRIKGVNDTILKFCMMAPSTAQPYIPYRIQAETEAFDAEFPGPEIPVPQESIKADEERPSRIKSLVRAQYQEAAARGPLHRWLKGAMLVNNSPTSDKNEDRKSEDRPK